MPLELESFEPKFLQVDLKPKDGAGGKRWELTVAVPPRRLQGRLPEDAAVILKTEQDRRIRVPVVGRATLALDGR
jgi:hypothetical protein